MRFANDWTARIDFTDFDEATSQIAATNAFEVPQGGRRLLMPSTFMFDEPQEIALSSRSACLRDRGPGKKGGDGVRALRLRL